MKKILPLLIAFISFGLFAQTTSPISSSGIKTADEYFNSGLLKQKLKDYDGAIADFSKAISLNPNDKEAYYNRGNSKLDLENYYEAIADYTKAIELNPDYTKAYYNRGVSKQKLKDY